jgi:hypothetical protein
MHTHLAAQMGQGSPLRPDSVTTNDILEPNPVVSLYRLDFFPVRLNHVYDGCTADEGLRLCSCRLRLHEHAY